MSSRQKFLMTVILFLVSILSFLIGCGGGGSDPSQRSLSQGQAESFANHISSSLYVAFRSMQSTVSEKAIVIEPDSSDKHAIQENTIESIQCNNTSCTVYWPINQTIATCTVGGRISVSGDITGSISSNGTGLLQIHLIETISDWSCITGFVINGDPYLSLTGTFSFFNGAPSSQQSIRMSGGIKWGTTAADSCQISLTTNFNSNGSGTTNGTICGRSINISF